MKDIIQKRRGRALRVDAAVRAFMALPLEERGECLACVLERFSMPGIADSAAAPRMTLKGAITDTLRVRQPLGTAEIFDAVLRALPMAKKGSVASVVTHMKGQGLIVRRGTGPRGALYGLPEGSP